MMRAQGGISEQLKMVSDKTKNASKKPISREKICRSQFIQEQTKFLRFSGKN